MNRKKPYRRLLLLSCTKKKKTATKLLPAIERYDGPAFQILRKFVEDCPRESGDLDVYILSARFGLLAVTDELPRYERRMTEQRANELNSQVVSGLRKILSKGQYKDFFINVGGDYLSAIEGYESAVPEGARITMATGSSGRRQTLLRNWLRGGFSPELPVPAQGRACIRGRKIEMTPDEILNLADQALKEKKDHSQSHKSWYVSVNGARVAPKWLISQLTGLSVKEFHSDEARRVLQQLGIKVHPM